MEYCSNGSLLQCVRTLNSENLTFQTGQTSSVLKLLVGFCIRIARGLRHIHKLGIVHRAISCKNIFIASDSKSCKIGNFSVARLMSKKTGKYNIPDMKVTRFECRWMAPEGYYEARFSRRSDIWSYGVVLWEIFSYGKVPYEEIKDGDLEAKILQENYRLPVPSSCPSDIYTLAHRCWNLVPAFRPKAAEARRSLEKFALDTLKVAPTSKNIYDYYNTGEEYEGGEYYAEDMDKTIFELRQMFNPDEPSSESASSFQTGYM